MRYLVNGVPAELPAEDGVTVEKGDDRLLVRGPAGTHSALAVRRGEKTFISYRGQVYEVAKATAKGGGQAAVSSGEVRAPMPGQIVDVFVKVGQTVAKGDKLMVLEAMKMQQPMVAAIDGRVDQLGAEKGEQVTDGQLLALVVEKSE